MQTLSLRVLTYNIHKGFSPGNRRFVLHRIREELRNTGADIGFFQEIQGEHAVRAARQDAWPDVSQFEFLADQVWSHYAYGKNAIYDAGHHGNAILSKYPFSDWHNINVSSVRRASRSILHGVVSLPEIGRELHVVCVHLDMMGHERRRQLRILNDRLRDHVPPHAPLILAGDFNDWRGQASALLDSDMDLHEVFQTLQGSHARTWPAFRPLLPLDRIYYRGLELTGARCLDQSHWRNLSDHVPLQAEFTLAGR